MEPFGALEPAVEAVTESGAGAGCRRDRQCDHRRLIGLEVTVCFAVPVMPLLPVTVAVTVYAPALLYA